MGRILLSGFNKLDPAEAAIVNNILKKYQTKLERFDFEYLKLDLKQKPHSKGGKMTLYELKGLLKTEKRLTSKSTSLNVFLIADEVLNKLLVEAEHRQRRKRQIR